MEFTYEQQTKQSPLETYEWDNIWWDHPELQKKRVLLIGDSISCGYCRRVNLCLKEEIFADGFGTSKGIDNPKFLEGLRYVKSQQNRCDLIHINNGLHGWHLSEEEYEKEYRKVLKEIMELYPDTPVVIALTTPLQPSETESDENRNGRVLKRNEVACRLAGEFGLEVNDLYAPLEHHPELFSQDGVHLIPEGYELLAKQIADVVRTALQ